MRTAGECHGARAKHDVVSTMHMHVCYYFSLTLLATDGFLLTTTTYTKARVDEICSTEGLDALAAASRAAAEAAAQAAAAETAVAAEVAASPAPAASSRGGRGGRGGRGSRGGSRGRGRGRGRG